MFSPDSRQHSFHGCFFFVTTCRLRVKIGNGRCAFCMRPLRPERGDWAYLRRLQWLMLLMLSTRCGQLAAQHHTELITSSHWSQTDVDLGSRIRGIRSTAISSAESTWPVTTRTTLSCLDVRVGLIAKNAHCQLLNYCNFSFISCGRLS